MVCFQEVVETWEVYWFGRCLGRGWREDLFGKEAKGRLKMGFRRPLVWVEREVV
ncbi:alpha-amylase [Morococcus cerebrosus]|uniref:alpha-amylase n=1 Tax=Morococcus cerebrosus TaxID=1056807 RepID=UPI0012E0441D|nr:alpha-amylase [Morococcus cerebrosus]